MILHDIETTLASLLRAADAGDGPDIIAATRRMDELRATAGSDLSPQLRHFLERRSYDKALAFVRQEEDIPRGSCR